MNKPYINSLSVTPNPVNVKGTITITVEAEDKEVIFGTEFKYARTSSFEVYAGEEGIM